MRPSESAKNEILPLTGVRGAAALWVLLYHFGEELSVLLPSFGVLEPFYKYGFAGVDLFFVLSGFIITFVHAREIDDRRIDRRTYLAKRFARIYPNHLLTMVALAVLVVGAGILGKKVEGSYGWDAFVGHLLLLHGSPLVSSDAWNYPSWSISAEFFGYVAVFPLTVALFRNRAVRKGGLFGAFALCSLFAIGWVIGWWGEWRNIARIVCEFSAGALLFHGVRAHPRFGGTAGRLLLPAGLGCLVLMFAPDAPGPGAVTLVAVISFCPLVIGGLSSGEGLAARILSTRSACWLGRISYALYMSHALVEKVLKVLLPVGEFASSSLTIRLVVFVIHLVAPIAVAGVIFRFWEEPMRRFVQGCLARRSPK